MPWGLGNLNMNDYISSLKGYEYSGGLSLEYVDPVSFKEPEKYLKSTKELFNSCI